MSKYLLFAGQDYYPLGGAFDLIGAFPDAESAEAAYWWAALNITGNYSCIGTWGHIVRHDSMEVIKELDSIELPRDRFPPVKPKRVRKPVDIGKKQEKALAKAFDDAMRGGE